MGDMEESDIIVIEEIPPPRINQANTNSEDSEVEILDEIPPPFIRSKNMGRDSMTQSQSTRTRTRQWQPEILTELELLSEGSAFVHQNDKDRETPPLSVTEQLLPSSSPSKQRVPLLSSLTKKKEPERETQVTAEKVSGAEAGSEEKESRLKSFSEALDNISSMTHSANKGEKSKMEDSATPARSESKNQTENQTEIESGDVESFGETKPVKEENPAIELLENKGEADDAAINRTRTDALITKMWELL